MLKIGELLCLLRSAMMGARDDQRQNVSSSGVCYGAGEPKAAAASEYLIAENRILRSQLAKRLRLTDAQRSTLAEIGERLGRKALSEVTVIVQPETIMAWYRRLVAQKFDGVK